MKRTSKSNIRALDVLEQFSTTQKPMTLKEITDAINAPHSSTSLLVTTLVEEGYLLRLGTHKHYFPAYRVFGIGSWLTQYNALSAHVLKAFRETDELGEVEVSIVTRKDLFCRHHGLDIDQSDKMISTYRKHAIPLISCPAGWSILSDLSDDEVAKICRRTWFELDESYNLDKTAIVLENVARCRLDGYAYMESTSIETPKHGFLAMRMPSLYEFPCACIQVKGEALIRPNVKLKVLENLSFLKQNWTNILTSGPSPIPKNTPLHEPLTKTG